MKIFPILEELKYVRENVKPISYREDDDTRIPDKLIGNNVLDFDDKGMLSKLEEFRAHTMLFQILRNSKEVNTIALENTYIRNGYYGTPDAETYAYMIASYKPDRIIEVGSGYSTIIARNTIDFYSLGTKISIIDPYPRTNIEKVVNEKILKPVESVDVQYFMRDSKTIVFIDSSHILRSGGDLPYIYNELVPKLPKGYLVHVHDIFLPYEYPQVFINWFYNEQYLLYALLTNQLRYKIEFATHYLSRRYPKTVEACLNTNANSKYKINGGAIWFKIQ